MTTPDPTAAARRRAIRDAYAAEEAENAAAEAAENDQAVISVRVPTQLAATLRARAAAEHTTTSGLIRRILADHADETRDPVLTVEQVEAIARRVVAESHGPGESARASTVIS